MIVINTEAGIRGVTYKTGEYKDARGNKRIRSEVFRFMPGNNEINPETWQKIREGLSDTEKDFYDTILKVVQPTSDESGYTIGPDEGEVDIRELDVNTAKDLVAGTVSADSSQDIAILEKYQKAEKTRKDKPPRKTVLDKIKEQIAEIRGHDKKRKEEKDKADNG